MVAVVASLWFSPLSNPFYHSFHTHTLRRPIYPIRHFQGKVDVLCVVCGDGSVLGITELQPPGKKVMPVRDFVNGLRGQYAIRWTVPPLPPADSKEVAGAAAAA